MLQFMKCLSPGYTDGQCGHEDRNTRLSVPKVHAPSTVTPEVGCKGEVATSGCSTTHESQGGRDKSSMSTSFPWTQACPGSQGKGQGQAPSPPGSNHHTRHVVGAIEIHFPRTCVTLGKPG